MRYVTHETVERARDVDLLSYLQSTSPGELVKCGADEYCTREHDSLKISHGKWYWWSHGVGGASALDYLIKVQGMDFIPAVEAVSNQTALVSSAVHSTAQKKKQLYLPPYNFECSKARAYLLGRGIDKDILNDFIAKGQIAESDETGSALFFGKNGEGQIKQCSERATDGTTNKKDSAGSDRSYFFASFAESPCPSVSVFESAIDLLSFATILKMRGVDYKQFNMMSLSGIYLPGKDETSFKIPTSLGRFLDEHKDTASIFLHLDSDYAGRRGAAGIITVLGDSYTVRYLPPKYGKDYNDYLMHLIHLQNLKHEKENDYENSDEKGDARRTIESKILPQSRKVSDGRNLASC